MKMKNKEKKSEKKGKKTEKKNKTMMTMTTIMNSSLVIILLFSFKISTYFLYSIL